LKGFGFVTFETPEQVKACLGDHDHHALNGRRFDCLACVKFGSEKFSPPDKEQIFVGGLPPSVTSASLEEYFSQFGEVVEADLKEERGFGFVRFKSAASVQLALHAYNDHIIWKVG